jgi:hypothetical protein
MYRVVALCCLILLLRSLPAMAQTDIHHCIGANGGAVFTDQPCSALQATPAQRVSPSGAGASLPATAQPPLVLCASSLGQLRQSVIDAFANREPNRVAGLMLWGGYGRGAAIADIRSLAAAMKQPLVGVDLPGYGDAGSAAPAPATSVPPDPFASEPAAAAAAPSTNQMVLHLGGMDGSDTPHELRFEIVRQAGCLWLRNAD